MRDDKVYLQHVVTGVYLNHGGHTYKRPIQGQKEICGVGHKDSNGLWTAEEGVFVKVNHGESEKANHDEF
jgi:dolichyl-phosphate-mannose--protein O-mannosyl transferase